MHLNMKGVITTPVFDNGFHYSHAPSCTHTHIIHF